MAYLLSIETATPICSVALHQDQNLLAYQELRLAQSHSSKLAVIIEQVLEHVPLTPAQLNGIAVSQGPGSYTGLRIGHATAKGLCFALNIPLIHVPTLQALAHMALPWVPPNALICPMIDARRMEVYCQFFNASGQPLAGQEGQPQAHILTPQSFAPQLEQGPVFFLGDGAPKSQEVLTHPNAHFPTQILPSAIGMGTLAQQRFDHQQFEDLAYATPFYLKEFKAGKPKPLL